ncbi:MAG: BREX-2 system adenine-specific DNA-methyltransferase PglX, partial [Planctomycetota bacterium]
MESVRGQKLSKIASEVGVVGMTNADDVLLAPKAAFHRRCIESVMVRRLVAGDNIRDWQNSEDEYSLFPYQHGELVTLDEYPRLLRWLWSSRTVLGSRATFGNSTYAEEGRPWWGWHQISHSRLENPVSVVFAYKATHNHFMLTNGSDVFNRTAPVVKVPEHGVTDTLLGVLGLLNCSLACFWERTVHRQVSGAGNEPWETRSERNITKIKDFYVPNVSPVTITKQLVHAAEKLKVVRPGNWVESSLGEKDASNRLSTILSGFREKHNSTVGEMIRLQEELDWECYHLYGLIEKKLTQREPPPLKLGERAFEIVLARKMAVGETQTTWFKRHGSTPITEMPAEWPEDYRLLVERRIELIENDPNIRLIEQPEYKRRWNTEPWESQLHRALRDWLLARLESYFDFDGRRNDAGRPTALLDVAMVSVAKLADLARQDAEFQQVGELYRDDPAFDVQALVAELVAAESVALLPVLRY